jgi:5'-deoxynucleotidase
MKNITRWSLMRNSFSENVQEHSLMTAVIAHCLAVIRRDVLCLDTNPDRVAVKALFHDASEIFTGDLPTPVKYFDPEMVLAYKRIESVASNKLLSALPAEMRPAYQPLLTNDDELESNLVRAADKLAAYIKCLEEQKAGNPEFNRAAEQTLSKLNSLKLKEVEYFIEHFIPAFELSLDDMNLSSL